MTLERFGLDERIERARLENGLEGFALGRIVAEHRERYVAATEDGETDAEVTGSLRFSARSREDFPAVGDWVALAPCGPEFALVQAILPRRSTLFRQAVDQRGERQIIAANIDHAFLVQALDRDFSANRLERYLTLCHASGVSPIAVLTKTDLVDEARLGGVLDGIRQRLPAVTVVALSNRTRDGFEDLERLVEKGRTYCLLGSSGVGKSTLLNNLSGRMAARTGAISESTGKGRHVTTRRELVVLENGAILIDNPGMREVGIADAGEGLEAAFASIAELGRRCRFKDCTHVHEAGCAVQEALEAGTLSRESWENWRKMEREREHFESSSLERRRKDRDFGRMLRNYQRDFGRDGF